MTATQDTPALLYMISPPVIDNVDSFTNQLRAGFDAGGELIGAFQLRLKQLGAATGDALTDPHSKEDKILAAAEKIIPVCAAYDVPFIMNDSPELASTCGADGVHLGQEDGDITQARNILGDDAIIGVSCHASQHLAMEAGDQGADYVAFGAFHPTPSKSQKSLDHWGRPTPDILQWWSSHAVLPCVAIGGITPQNAAPLLKAGADFIAVLSYLWHHHEGTHQAVAEFVSLLQQPS